ncbi:5-formyltetrahydrofolate cyclo-ligase [Candidatus Parcubacteria bacterium]|nr:5-formyltetrahydrofolate cyclo-ligase [Candidatus Parcubacteria bacterium]
MHSGKQKLRKKLLLRRQLMDAQEVAAKSNNITHTLIDSVDWRSVKFLHIYTPLRKWNEIDTGLIKATAAQRWPHIEIVSPAPDKNQPFPVEKFDLIIVPVLGFDKDKYRLGYGGGWYDRFLAGQKQARTIGLAYKDALIENLPRESHDISLTTILTD